MIFCESFARSRISRGGKIRGVLKVCWFLTTNKMPNIVDDFYVRDDIFAVDVQHKSIVVCESEGVVDFRSCVADKRPVIEVIVGLNPRTERNLVEILRRSFKLHVIVDARLFKVE